MGEHLDVRAARWFVVYTIAALAAIFFFPYYFPLTPSASASYLFGYNNRAAVLILLILVAAGVIGTRGLHLRLLAAANSQPIRRKVFLYSLAAVLLVCAALYLLTGRLGGFGESGYEIDRIWLTSIGKRPYIDFEWPFGVISLYVPLAIHRLLSLSIPQAYYIFWCLNCLAGAWLLYEVLNAIDYPSERKTSIYLLLFCGWFLAILNLGTHYSLTRYALPLYFVLLIERRISRGDARSYAIADLEILLFTAVLLLYSPETAIAYGITSLALFPILARRRDAAFFAAFATLLPALAALFVAASRIHILDTVFASGGGADSFPIFLCPHILLFFVVIFVCACYAYRQIIDPRMRGNSLGLIAYSVVMLPAALGRCDPGHTLLNSLGIYAVFLLCASSSARFWKPARTAFILILLVIASLSGLWFYLPLFARGTIRALAGGGEDSYMSRLLLGGGRIYIQHFVSADRKQQWQQRLESLPREGEPENADLSVVFPEWHGGYLAPFGFRPNGFGTDLTRQVDYGKYEDVENANTPAAIAEKVAEMRTHPGDALLLPKSYFDNCLIDVPAQRRTLEILLAFPYWKAPAHLESVRLPMCAYIRQHYSLAVPPTEKTYGYGLWINNANGQPAALIPSG